MVYIVNCDELKFFKTFKSLDDIISFFVEKNKVDFNGEPFSLFGRGQEVVNDGERSYFVEKDYYIDSIVLCSKFNPNKYFSFFIRRINSKGESIELDYKSNK